MYSSLILICTLNRLLIVSLIKSNLNSVWTQRVARKSWHANRFPVTSFPHHTSSLLPCLSFLVPLSFPSPHSFFSLSFDGQVPQKSSTPWHRQEVCKKPTGASDAQPDATDDDAEGSGAPKAPSRVVWDKYPHRTEHLLDYLDAHLDTTLKLFGDSTKTAKQEGCSKLTAKSNKGVAYLQLADGIFSIDEDAAIRSDFSSTQRRSITTSQTRMYWLLQYSWACSIFFRLKKQYRAANEHIGKTGAGLKPEDVMPGSEIANLIG